MSFRCTAWNAREEPRGARGAEHGSIQKLTQRWVTVKSTLGVVAALVLAMPPLFWVIRRNRRASLTTLGVTQGILSMRWAVQGLSRLPRCARCQWAAHQPVIWCSSPSGEAENNCSEFSIWRSRCSFALVGACCRALLAKRGGTWLARSGVGLRTMVV